jgi:Tfp pilus assembly protein PilN
MSRLSRNSEGPGPQRIAAVQHIAGAWRVVIADVGSGRATLVDAQSVREAGAQESLGRLLKDQRVERIVRVAPGAETIARTLPIPEGAPEAVGAALRLLAEAELPDSLPPHRRAAGAAEGAGRSRSALVVGWNGTAAQPLAAGIPEFWTAPVAALSILRSGGGYAACAEPASGSISVVASGPDRTIARVLREDNAPSAWDRAVHAAIMDTLRAAGIEIATRSGPAPEVLLDVDSLLALKDRVRGWKDESRWVADYAACIGAVLLAGSPDPLVRPLAEMTASGRAVKEPLPERVATWLSERRHAYAAAAIAAGIILVAPLGFAAARLGVLNAKSAGLTEALQSRQETAARAALYAQLEQVRWPMTKLMADVAGATPVGVVLDECRIAVDQGLTIRGSAENSDQLYTLQKNLSATRVFKDVVIPRYDGTSRGVEFELSAAVASPSTVSRPAEDFAAAPLAVRLYGAGASNTAPPVAPRGRETREAAHISRGAENAPARGPAHGAENAPPTARPTEDNSRRPAAADKDEVPPPLSDEEIAKMDKNTAMKEWVRRRTYPQTHPKLEPEVKQRLEEEAAKAKAQMDKAKAAETGGAP